MTSMPEPTPIDRAHDEREEVVLGVDTHKDLHVAAVLSGLGALLATRAFPTTTLPGPKAVTVTPSRPGSPRSRRPLKLVSE